VRSVPLILVSFAVVSVAVVFAIPSRSCSRILWNDNGLCVLVGRNMDSVTDFKSNVWVLPRGMRFSSLDNLSREFEGMAPLGSLLPAS
jgi:penicillin V acylase-like amidase (Ntn superfamily)